MVTTVPAGKTYQDMRLLELGVDLAARQPGSGELGYRMVVVNELPLTSEMLDNVIYCVRAAP